MESISQTFENFAERLREHGVTFIEPRPHDDARTSEQISDSEIPARVAQVLREPLGFPPIAQATVPGDHVAIVIDPCVPQASAVTGGVIRGLQSAGVEAENMTVVTADAAAAQRLEGEVAERGYADVTFEVHDPRNDEALCYVGMTAGGEPLLIARPIVEADLVIPVGCTQHQDALISLGIHDTIFPSFADIKTLAKWRSPLSATPEARNQWRKLTDEAGWLLGVAFVVEVVPGPGGTIHGVLGGDPNQVHTESVEHYESYWQRTVPNHGSLLIVTVSDEHGSCQWTDLAQAIQVAQRLLGPEGALAICCGSLPKLGRSFKRLANYDDLAGVQRDLEGDQEPDTRTAWQLSQALQQGPVFLYSDLDEDQVEDLGMGPIRDFTQLVRLASRYENCIVLEDAQHVLTAVDTSQTA